MRRTLLATAALVALCSPVFGQLSPPAAKPAQPLRGVAIRSSYSHNFNLTTNVAGGTFRQYYQIAATGPVYSLVVCYQNATNTNVTEKDGPGALGGVTASLELSTGTTAPFTLASLTSLSQFTFNGAIGLPAILPSGGYFCSDEMPVQMVPGQSFYIRSFVPPGVPYPVYQGFTATNIELANNGQYSAIITGLAGNGVQTVFSGTIDTAHTTGNPGTNIVLPLRAGTGRIVAGNIGISDDGAGNLTGAGVTGTITYATGAFSLTFSPALGNGLTFVAYGLSRGSTTLADETMVSPGFAGNVAQYTGWTPTLLTSFAPAMILGRVTGVSPIQKTLCVSGDSIVSGVGNLFEDVDYAEYMGTSLGILRFGQGGERAFDFAAQATNFRRLKTMLGHCDKVLVNYGHNDINVPRTFVQIKADLTTVWSNLAAILPHGYRDITQAALSPYTTSNAVNTPINANWDSQTVVGGTPSMRNAVNNWICSQIGVLIGAMLDVNLALENVPATCAGAGDGTWKQITDTFDGRHYSQQGAKITLPAMFSPTGTNPAPVFDPLH